MTQEAQEIADKIAQYSNLNIFTYQKMQRYQNARGKLFF